MPIPTTSVIMPVHNGSKWLKQALTSILDSKDDSVEVIVIDDGSTDESAAIIKSMMATHHALKLITNSSNLGIVASLNRGLQAARGRFIARMDADDITMPSRFSRQIHYLEQTGCDLCGTWFIEFGQGIPRTVRWPHDEDAVRAAMLFQNTILHPTILARREVFEEFQYREEYRLAEDYDLLTRVCSKFRVANLPEPLLRYRRHPRQATQARRAAMEDVTRRIRIQALRQQGFDPSPEEERLHNLVRAPVSIRNQRDLRGIETWLLKLHQACGSKRARDIVASQWVRACIRAAPLRGAMWDSFRGSALYTAAGVNIGTGIDVYLLSRLGLDYRSKSFEALRRLGISA
jgi:glycosyltransferase involved in cell wall biosynthesis